MGVLAIATALALFPRAFPAIALDNRLTPATALARADSFFAAHTLAAATERRAVRFESEDSLLTYVDLAAGGSDSVNALVKGRDAALFEWSVRAFTPGDVHEARVTFAPDGRVLGFRRKLADADARPSLDSAAATALAQEVLGGWLGESTELWRLVTSSYETRKPSDRRDRTLTFERTDRRIGDAPLRLDVVIGGDTPIAARPYVYVPETFSRRYDEMRSANSLLSLFSTGGIIALMLLGIWSLRTHSRAHELRWRQPIVVGGVIGALFAGAAVNGLGGSWFDYDTAMPAFLFQALVFGGALVTGLATAAMVTLTLVAAEASVRSAFPRHVDWWKLWKYRGTREVAGQVGGGYVVAAIGFAYVATFYVVTRHVFGWWVPSELLDDPNQIATPAPWLSGIAFSLQAGVWEETLFRALPLSLLSLWVGNRPRRTWWMAGGVVATALVFGFAHAAYPSWPPYSRGVEIFLDASFWAVLFLRFGLLVTVLAHFTYDLVLFSLFAATGTAPEYRMAAAIAALALLSPALAVGWRALRQGGLVATPDDARFGAWRRDPEVTATGVVAAVPVLGALSVRSRQLVVAAVVIAASLAVAVPRPPVRGPEFTATHARAVAVSDSMLSERGVPVAGWRRLTETATDTVASWPRFLRVHQLDSLAASLAPTYAVPAWWVVRYVHTDGALAERAEEWRVRVFPDGRALDVHHIVADSARGASPSTDSARGIARLALASAGIDTLHLKEAQVDEKKRPHRLDATLTWIDTTVHLPEGATARAWVTLAGTEPLVVRRGIDLPETFQRAERDRTTRTFAMAGLFGFLIFAGVVTGVIVVARKRPALVTDRMFDSRTSRALVALLSVTIVAGALNSWPSALYGYDTATPWGNHLAFVSFSLVFSLLGVLALVGLWSLCELLRRRAGIVAWPDSATSARDAFSAGIGLGAVFALSGLLPETIRHVTIAPAPVTSLNGIVPALSGTTSLAVGVIVRVTITAIPVLMILGLTRVRRTRWLLVVLLAALGAGVVAPISMSANVDGVQVAEALFSVGASVAALLALRWWAPRGAFTWLVAALSSTIATSLRQAVHGVTIGDQASGVLAAAAAGVAIWWLWRRANALRGGDDDRVAATAALAA